MQLKNQSLLLLMIGVLALLMFVPAIFALQQTEHHISRSFFYAGSLTLIILWMIAIAMSTRVHGQNPLRQLLSLGVGFMLLPAIATIPFAEVAPNKGFLDAYIEMVCALTTTGGTLYAPSSLSDSLHLWRALLGWYGGAIMWIAALAIFAPLGLGGYELAQNMLEFGRLRMLVHRESPHKRILRAAEAILPIYIGLTLVLFVLLQITGQAPFSALIAAFSVISTSGIVGAEPAMHGIWSEIIIAIFFIFAITRISFMHLGSAKYFNRLGADNEFRLGIAVIVIIPILLFLRHWFGGFASDSPADLHTIFRVFWGAAFTVLSFLTTTGIESTDWEFVQEWSGLKIPAILFMGLAILGGGIGTTAGGVKLLRIYFLMKFGRRELDHLIYPSSVARSGETLTIGYMAWVFFMFFAITLGGAVVVFSLFSVPFEQSFILAISAITTTGPLLDAAFGNSIALTQFSPSVKLFYGVIMVLGRMETLALVALFTSDILAKRPSRGAF